MEAITAEWVRLARRDIGTARVALSAGDPENALYLTQQALEKALKARIQDATGEPPPFTHNLIQLAKMASIWDSLVVGHQALLDEVDPYMSAGRYGATSAGPSLAVTPSDAGRIVREAGELVGCLLQDLK